MPGKKTWEIQIKKAITFEAELTNEDLEAIQASVVRALRASVLATLEEHGLLERGAPVSFSDFAGNPVIIKPGKTPKANP